MSRLAHTALILRSRSDHYGRGCPTRRGFRRVGTTDPYSLGPAILRYGRAALPLNSLAVPVRLGASSFAQFAKGSLALEWRKRNKIYEWASPH
jgi:hypothetical protein